MFRSKLLDDQQIPLYIHIYPIIQTKTTKSHLRLILVFSLVLKSLSKNHHEHHITISGTSSSRRRVPRCIARSMGHVVPVATSTSWIPMENYASGVVHSVILP